MSASLGLHFRCEAGACPCCSKAANGFLSFFGGGRETGVYAVPTGAIRHPRTVWVGTGETTAGGGVNRVDAGGGVV